MNEEFFITQIIDFVNEKLKENQTEKEINESSALIGGDSLLDSLGLVELCLFLEDLSSENDFEFDWTSRSALSKSRSMFRSPKVLAAEVIKQYKQQCEHVQK